MTDANQTPRSAMVLAAGLGTRMRPLTATTPKPLIKVGGKTLLDHMLDRLAEVGVETAVVNVHYLAEQIERHVAGRRRPRISISDERPQLLGTGGAVMKALAQLGGTPFFHVNADTLWIEGGTPNLQRLAQAFDAATMDGLLLLAPTSGSIGYDGRGDFAMAPDGRLTRPGDGETAPCVYAGAAILTPALFKGSPQGAFALTPLLERAATVGRLFGLRLDGLWMHVGSPDAVPAAEAAFRTRTG